MSERGHNGRNFFSVGATTTTNLRAEFAGLLGTFSASPALADETVDLLLARYAEEARFYHNLSHVAALLAAAEELGEKIADARSVRLAAWFHDAVYDPRRRDNEPESAKLAGEKLRRLSFPAAEVAKIEQMILATQHHDASELDADGRLFLDLDLMILGAEKRVYREYCRAIRREYSFVPESLYSYARAKILGGFLGREFIYLTEEMREKFEGAARANVAREVEELSKGDFEKDCE